MIDETVQAALSNLLSVIEEGSAGVRDFNKLIEATQKSTRERVSRHVRKSVPEPGGHSMVGRVVPKKTGNNDPRQHRGKRNFKGSEKRKQDQEKARNPHKYTEAVEFINKNKGQSIDESMIAQVSDPSALAFLATRLMREPGIDNDWLFTIKRLAEEATSGQQ